VISTSAGARRRRRRRRRRRSAEDPQLVLETANLLFSVPHLLLQHLDLVELPKILLQ